MYLFSTQDQITTIGYHHDVPISCHESIVFFYHDHERESSYAMNDWKVMIGLCHRNKI
jgi:hypothetical protein